MAVIKTIFKGESLSLLFTFPVAYDMARIEKHEVYIGETAFTGTVSGQTIALKLKSDDTGIMSGQYKVALWIDDSILGVKKPYLGDITIANTQAVPHNSSTSEVYDVVVNVDITVTSIDAGDLLFNYVKGSSAYEVWLETHEGTLEDYEAWLQQPAADAAASVQGVEQAVEQAEGLRVTAEQGRATAEGLRVTAESNRSGAESDRAGAELLRAGAEDTREMNEYNREQAEALRVQAEIDRQTNTGTAIQNAETATQGANNAATNANTKAGLADDAANNANAKATLANDAAILANTKAGLADAAANNANAIANSKPTIFEGYANLPAGVETLISGTSFTPVLNLRPINIQVFYDGMLKTVDARYVVNGDNCDVYLTATEYLMGAEIILLGSKLNRIPVPTLLSLTVVSDISTQLSWTYSDECDGYVIERSVDNIIFTEIDRTVLKSYQDDTCIGNVQYYYRVKAYKGLSTGNYSDVVTDTTNIPAESIDGNFYGIYEASSEANIITGSYISQLRDLNQNTEDTTNIFGDLSSSDGWTIGSGWSIDTTNKKIIGAVGQSPANISVAALNSYVYKVIFTIESITGSVSVLFGGTPYTSYAVAGTYELTAPIPYAAIGFIKPAASTCVISNVSCYKILGNHAVNTTAALQPSILNNIISFNGTSQYLATGVITGNTGGDKTWVGSLYLIVKKPTDQDFVIQNTSSEAISFANQRMSIGTTVTKSAYYDIDFKALYWSKNTNENVVRRLTNYYAHKYNIVKYSPPINIQTVAEVEINTSRAFPGMVMVGNRIYVCYRKAVGHMTPGGVICSKYSDDFGYTWSEEAIIYDGSEMYVDYADIFTANPTAVLDCRDTRMILTDDGYLLTVGFVAIVTGANETYTFIKVILVTHRVPIVNGVPDWTNKTKIEVDNTKPRNAFGGGILNKDGVIYITGYDSTVGARLYKSTDNGLTWGNGISIHGATSNECTLNFVGETLYCTLRNTVWSNGNILRKSTDYGETWDAGIDNYTEYCLHGLSSITLPDNKYLVVGRDNGCSFIIMDDSTQVGEKYKLMPSLPTATTDAGYAQVIKYNDWYYFTWYRAEIEHGQAGIYFAKLKEEYLLSLY